MALQPQQLRILHVARRELQLDEDTYRDLLSDVAGVRSASDLTSTGFRAVMARFESLGFKSKPKRRHRPPRTNAGALPTGRQRKLIAALFAEVGFDTDERRAGFCRRCTGHTYPHNRAEANRVIEGLKAIKKRAQNVNTKGKE